MANKPTRNVSRVKGFTLRDLVNVARNSDNQSLSVPYLIQCASLIREAYVFSLLTVNENTKRAENAMLAWREAGCPEDEATIRSVCGPHSPLVKATNVSNKAENIAKFLAEFRADPQSFMPIDSESASAYRDRMLTKGIRGLALTKTTWACQLVTGGGNIACLDRHMMRIMLGRQVTNDELNTRKTKTIKLYRRLERVLVYIAERYGWQSASALQWSVWSTALKEIVSHDVVYGALGTVQYRTVYGK